MSFTSKDLQYKYRWIAAKENDNSKIKGFPDDLLLDRDEGYEILYYINRFMDAHKQKNLDTFKKIATMIHDYLPGKIRGRIKIKEWLETN